MLLRYIAYAVQSSIESVYTNVKHYFVQSCEGFSVRGKELERNIAALRLAEGDAAPNEKNRRNDEIMFGIGIISK